MDKLVENSTIHGVTHIYTTKNKIVKIFWMSLIIVGIGGIVANIGYVIAKYLKYPLEVTLTFEEPFEWPEFTFCNPTAPFLVKENSSEHIYWEEVLNKIDNILINASDLHRQWKYKRMCAMASIYMQRFRFNFHDYLTSFNLLQTGVEGFMESNGTYFPKEWVIANRMVYIEYNVPCYSLKLSNSSLENNGSTKDLKLAFKLDYDSNKIFNRGYSPRSLYLFIDNVDEMPQGKPYILTPGYKYTFDISQNRYINKKSRRSCRTERFTIDLYDSSMTNSTLYEGNYRDCAKYIWQTHSLEYCKCYWQEAPIPKLRSEFPGLCLNATLFTPERFLVNMNCARNLHKSFEKECEKYKLRKCDSKTYKVSLQKEELFEKPRLITKKGRDNLFKLYGIIFPEYVNRTDFIDVVRDNLLQVVINRENDFVDLRKEEYSYIFSQLLSDIGGLMGLCLGISFVGLFELALLLYYFFKSICKEKFQECRKASKWRKC